MVEANFLAQSELPLLRNGEEPTTSFGAVSGDSNNESWLRYGAEVEISVLYQDLEGRKYQSRLPLKIRQRRFWRRHLEVLRKTATQPKGSWPFCAVNMLGRNRAQS